MFQYSGCVLSNTLFYLFSVQYCGPVFSLTLFFIYLVASIAPHPHVLSLLLSFGPSRTHLTVTNKSGQTAREVARGEAEIVWKLFEEGGLTALSEKNYKTFSR